MEQELYRSINKEDPCSEELQRICRMKTACYKTLPQAICDMLDDLLAAIIAESIPTDQIAAMFREIGRTVSRKVAAARGED